MNPLLLYYNKEIFAQLGLEFPSAEWDWGQAGRYDQGFESGGVKRLDPDYGVHFGMADRQLNEISNQRRHAGIRTIGAVRAISQSKV